MSVYPNSLKSYLPVANLSLYVDAMKSAGFRYEMFLVVLPDAQLPSGCPSARYTLPGDPVDPTGI